MTINVWYLYYFLKFLFFASCYKRQKLKNSYIMNKDWINLQFQDPFFLEGIESFLNFARENISGRQTILCPCNKCGNQRLWSTYDDVKYDLVKYGFNSTYKVWDLHCESITLEANEWASTFQHQSNKELMENLDQDFIKSTCKSVAKSSNEIDEEDINIMLEDGEHILE